MITNAPERTRMERIIGGIDRAKQIALSAKRPISVHIEIQGDLETVPSIKYCIEELAPEAKIEGQEEL